MRKRKPQIDEELATIEHHVDQMMDVKLPDTEMPDEARKTVQNNEGPPPLDIFADRQTAPILEANESVEEATGGADSPEPGSATAAEVSKEPKDDGIAPAFEDSKVDALVDQIVSQESDAMLAAQDAEIGKAFDNSRPGLGERIRAFFSSFWQNRTARYGVLTIILGGIIVVGTLPASRYYVLNNAGVRSAASLTIIDNATQVPLKNITVELGDQKSRTDAKGVVKLNNLKLGTQQLNIEQTGFAPVSQKVTLGWGSNPLGDFSLRPVGIQFTFKLTDYLSSKPVKEAEITTGDSTAQADKNGDVVLTLGSLSEENLSVTISAAGYRREKFKIDPNIKQAIKIVLVPSQKVVFVSKQSGKYDVYKIDLDGKNKQLVLAGTGNEDGQIALVQQPGGNGIAIVSKRDAKVNQDGYPLQSLTLLDIEKGRLLNLDQSEDIRMVDWIDDRLIYVKVRAGTSAGNASRYQLVSYDYEAADKIQLASANYFNEVISAKKTIYYASSNNYQGGKSQFVKINPDNSGRQVLIDDTDIWSVQRANYSQLNLSTVNGWYEYKIGDSSAKKLTTSPSSASEARFYLDSADDKYALWTDSRDGKVMLLVTNSDTQKDKGLVAQSGLNFPIRWLNPRTVVYRVVTTQETAEYALSLDGGQPRKITDVTNTIGFGKWYYR